MFTVEPKEKTSKVIEACSAILNYSEETFYALRCLNIMKILKHLKTDWFRYGFETLAVIVGILVAFSLENWRENRNVHKERIQIIHSLRAELALDTVFLNGFIERTQRSAEHKASLMSRMRSPQASLDTIKYIAQYDYSPGVTLIKEFNTISIKSLVSTGKIELLSREIKTALIKLELIQTRILDQNNLNIYLRKAGAYSEKYPFNMESSESYLSRISWEIEDEREFVMLFTNSVGFHYTLINNKLKIYEEALVHTKDIISILTKEIP